MPGEMFIINNCENRASILRQWLSVHRGVSKDNLDTYLSLFQLQRKNLSQNYLNFFLPQFSLSSESLKIAIRYERLEATYTESS